LKPFTSSEDVIPAMPWEILDRIRQHLGQLTPRQRRVADLLARDPRKLAFTSAAALAQQAGVSEATVIRLAISLGYDGFADMQARLQAQANQQLEQVGLARLSTLRGGFGGQGDILTTVARRHQENIQATVAGVDPTVFQAVAQRLATADRVRVAAHHWSRSLGLLLVDLLRSVTFDTQMFGGQEEREWQLATLTDRSVVVGIGFPRYTAETLALLRGARDRGAAVVALTDSIASPLAEWAHHVLPVAGDSTQPGADYFAGAVTLLYALHIAASVAGGGDDARLQALQAAYHQMSTFIGEE
jgi:DNA-binding MurR/RpiR family transcriptional regulator